MVICKSISGIYDAFLLKLCFRFIDCDMFMQFQGGGVSHKSIQKKIQKFCDDRWPEEHNDKPLCSSTQPADENKEETAAQPKGSSLINPNAEDIELCDGEDIELPEEEAESNSEALLLGLLPPPLSFHMMSSPPVSSFTSSTPAPPGFYDASSSEVDLDQMLRERAQALMEEMDLGKEELLPSSLTG
jgi:hypothetical protein